MRWYRYHDVWPHLAVLETPGEAPPSWFGCRDEDWHGTEQEALKARLHALRAPVAAAEYAIAEANKSLRQFEDAARAGGLPLPGQPEVTP